MLVALILHLILHLNSLRNLIATSLVGVLHTVNIISKRLLGLCKRSTKLGKRLPQLWKRLLKQCLVS